ncbi:MAG: response regulator [Drouetiella hepatica Uher 2000/2452]|uniref:Adenylate cyclase n=1 Tax=Drouetiella hepatica Uher 2000/2452 TaxID=904376 RepID=A0A951QC93_9CYAN|nr:response regulator [Drouetiella hepatica Uher 2000/2452]
MNSDPPEASRGSILIVDDAPNNLVLLSRLLTQKGYAVRAVKTGKLALEAIATLPPELILMDICMPEMDGYTICQKLKSSEQTRDIPIIFISALDEVLDKIRAFAVGGVDYITKPFQLAEVLARVETHLTLQRLRQELQLQNERLHHEITERQKAEDKYRSIFENCLEGLFQVTSSGRYISANPTLAKIYGYASAEELMISVTNICSLYVRPGRREELNAYLRRYAKVEDFESQVYRKDGGIIWISENVRAVRGESGEVLYYEGTVQDTTERRLTEAELRLQRQEAERLLLSILPQSIAERLKRKPETIADSFADVTVMFADLVNFTPFAAQVPPKEMVEILNQIFSAFDQLAEQYGLEKIKTIGDEYMVAGGLPNPQSDHVEAVADMALAMLQTVAKFPTRQGKPFQLRIGINTGPVVAGVIGTKKFSYDLWGETVNLASRMETQGQAGYIQIAPATFDRLKNKYWLERRGVIEVRGFGEIATHWLIGKL